jgi:hypothetical protein
VNVPEWPSYSFDLNLFENLWQDLKMVKIVKINNQFDLKILENNNGQMLHNPVVESS